MKVRPKTRPACSFCGKAQEQVKKLVAGPGVFICDDCVGLCVEIFDNEGIAWRRP